jgi:hypothetical protein
VVNAGIPKDPLLVGQVEERLEETYSPFFKRLLWCTLQKETADAFKEKNCNKTFNKTVPTKPILRLGHEKIA